MRCIVCGRVAMLDKNEICLNELACIEAQQPGNAWHPTEDASTDARNDRLDAELEFAGATAEEANQEEASW